MSNLTLFQSRKLILSFQIVNNFYFFCEKVLIKILIVDLIAMKPKKFESADIQLEMNNFFDFEILINSAPEELKNNEENQVTMIFSIKFFFHCYFSFI